MPLQARADGRLTRRSTHLSSSTLNWRGDKIYLTGERTLRVVDTRLDEGTDGDPVSVLVVEPA